MCPRLGAEEASHLEMPTGIDKNQKLEKKKEKEKKKKP